MLSDPLVNPDKVSVPVVFEVYAIRSLSIKTVPVAGIPPESDKTILVEPEVNAPSNVAVISPATVPPQRPSPQPAADSSTAGPID